MGALFILVVTLFPQGLAGLLSAARASRGEPGMSALLHVDAVTVDYGGFKALDGFSLDLAQGETRVVIGPNGAGKSTLCDTIIGRVRPTHGAIRFMGEDISRLSEPAIVARGICRKFQAPGVLPSLTVQDNMALAARTDRRWWKALGHGIPAAERAFVAETLDRVGLSARRALRPGNCPTAKSNGWKSAWSSPPVRK
jgi:urea transport system ATP-binding protein